MVWKISSRNTRVDGQNAPNVYATDLFVFATCRFHLMNEWHRSMNIVFKFLGTSWCLLPATYRSVSMILVCCAAHMWAVTQTHFHYTVLGCCIIVDHLWTSAIVDLPEVSVIRARQWERENAHTRLSSWGFLDLVHNPQTKEMKVQLLAQMNRIHVKCGGHLL